MTAFLNDFSKFYGTGEKNEAGQNLEEFLELYDPRKYETPSNTTDAVLVTGHCRAVLPICGRI